MSSVDHTYQELMKQFKEIVVLQSSLGILNWDMETKMPPKGVNLRSEQMALLTGIEHTMITDPNFGTLLEGSEKHPEYDKLDIIQKRNIALIRKIYDENTSLPKELVVEIERQRAITINIWKKAKAAQNFSMFKPELEKLVALKKTSAEILKDVKRTPTEYDALIDIFEPKMLSHAISTIFNQLRKGLISLIEKCHTAIKQPDVSLLTYPVPIRLQEQISTELARFMGYDVESQRAGGRIDETEHPFTTGYYDDVRITTHYYEQDFSSSLFSVLHEGGHALYEQNLNPEWMYQPVGASCSHGFHESQSRFMENIIGRSREFWEFFFPRLKQHTNDTFSDITLDRFVFAINRVKPSKIRVMADEVTYCLHIIIRFEIEQDLMRDRITVAELPEVWNQKYRDYLDVTIDNDSEGVMQDTHWAGGLIGYFPTYALGNIYSGQLLAQMQNGVPAWRDQLKKGTIENMIKWFSTKIYQKGNLFDPMELMKQVVGEEINVKYYLNYLEEKYSNLYDF